MPCPISEWAHCSVTLPSVATAIQALSGAAALACAAASFATRRPPTRTTAPAANPCITSRRDNTVPSTRMADLIPHSRYLDMMWQRSLCATWAPQRSPASTASRFVRRTRGAGLGPDFDRFFKFIPGQRRPCASDARGKSPQHQLIRLKVLDEISDAAAAVALLVEHPAANLAGGEALPRHRAGSDVPVRRPGDARHVVVVLLMALRAPHHRHAAIIRAALNVLQMDVPVVALSRSLAARVTVHAARTHQNRSDTSVGRETRSAVARLRPGFFGY